MNRIATPLPGVFLIEPVLASDERGFFTRTFDAAEFRAWGMNPQISQCSVSFNRHRGTVRGLHYQVAPHAEAKLVRCTRGAIYDVALDLRRGSPTFKRWYSAELSSENRQLLYIPEGVAHGYQTLSDNTEVFYEISADHHPDSARGVCWDDPEINIQWPLVSNVIISERDRNLPVFQQLIMGEESHESHIFRGRQS